MLVNGVQRGGDGEERRGMYERCNGSGDGDDGNLLMRRLRAVML